jgi:BMFP domain-containing protein YqiC
MIEEVASAIYNSLNNSAISSVEDVEHDIQAIAYRHREIAELEKKRADLEARPEFAEYYQN